MLLLQYEATLLERRISIENIYKYGIVFEGKQILIG